MRPQNSARSRQASAPARKSRKVAASHHTFAISGARPARDAAGNIVLVDAHGNIITSDTLSSSKLLSERRAVTSASNVEAAAASHGAHDSTQLATWPALDYPVLPPTPQHIYYPSAGHSSGLHPSAAPYSSGMQLFHPSAAPAPAAIAAAPAPVSLHFERYMLDCSHGSGGPSYEPTGYYHYDTAGVDDTITTAEEQAAAGPGPGAGAGYGYGGGFGFSYYGQQWDDTTTAAVTAAFSGGGAGGGRLHFAAPDDSYAESADGRLHEIEGEEEEGAGAAAADTADWRTFAPQEGGAGMYSLAPARGGKQVRFHFSQSEEEEGGGR